MSPSSKERLEAFGRALAPVQRERERADTRSARPADRQAGGQGPHDVGEHGAAKARGAGIQRERQQDPGRGEAVVHPALGGEAEAHRVALGDAPDLHVGGEHGVGRRNDRREQERARPAEVEKPPPRERGRADGDRHFRAGETQRHAPRRIAERHTEPQPHAEERQHDADLRDRLDQRQMPVDVEVKESETAASERVAEREVKHRGAE
jgi:hypothetical protein